MRALIGGIVGTVVSTVAWLGIEHLQQVKYSWLVVLVGLVTGVFVNKAGSNTTAGFARGALALILTLAGIVGGQKGYAKFMEATVSTEAVASAAKFEGQADDPASEDEGDAESDTASPAPVLSSAPVAMDQPSYSKSTMKKNFGEWDMVWMCVAALAAYVTGKGGGSTVDESAEQPEEDAADSGSADDPAE